jgi:serine/threonine protein kinase
MRELAEGRYTLEEVIGQGGFATVWRGFDTALGVHRAIKILHPELGTHGQHRERLRAEASTMARLAHPNVLSIHDIGQQDGKDWFVMDLVQGGSLGDWLQRGGAMPPDLAVSCAIQVLSALGAAHAAGVVHRDIKPQNILLDTEGRCRLADFGIALLSSEERLRSTRTGATLGSLAYMAPEQRIDAREVGPTADLYAMGSTLFALLSNANAIDLFTATPESPRWAPVPPPLRPILQRATRHLPSQRYDSAAALAGALEEARAELPRESWDSWLGQVSAIRTSSGPTLVAPTAALLQRSTARAITILEPAPPPAQATLVLEDLDSAREGPGDPQLRDEPRPRPSAAWWLLALLPLAGALLVWSAWQAPPASDPAPQAQVTVEPAPMPAEQPAPMPAEQPAPPAPSPREAAAPAVDDGAAPEPAEPPGASRQPDEQPAASAPRPSAVASSTLAGRWKGSLGAVVTTLVLEGSDDALVGSIESSFMGNVQASRVRGRYKDGTLLLEDQDRSQRYAGTYRGSLGPEGRLEGQCTTYDGDRVTSFSFSRAATGRP